jgi:hypothetical protein
VLAPVCPRRRRDTLAARSRAAGHRHSPSSLLTADPCQPRPQAHLSPGLAVLARRLRVAALVLRPRSPPSCVAPAGRSHSSPPQLIADNAHRRSSPPRGSTPRLATPVSIILLSRAWETPQPACPALFSGQLLNHLPLAARRRSPPPLRLAAPARPGPLLAIAPFKLSAWARDQPIAFTLCMYLHVCSGPGPGSLPARLFTHLAS